MTGSTIFDLVIVVLVLISAGMSAMRGLIRESFAIITLCVGVLCGYLSLIFLRDPVRVYLPQGWPEFVLSGLVIVFGFLGAYAISAWTGERLARLARSVGDLGALDSLCGAGFGLARAAVLLVAAHIAFEKVVSPGFIPAPVLGSMSYPYIRTAADWVESILPGLYEVSGEGSDTDDGSRT